MPRKSPYSIILDKTTRARLEELARTYTSPYRDVIRAKIALYAADGLGNDEIGARLDTPRQIVSKWRKRFFEEGLIVAGGGSRGLLIVRPERRLGRRRGWFQRSVDCAA
jgi:hypothetical protein